MKSRMEVLLDRVSELETEVLAVLQRQKELIKIVQGAPHRMPDLQDEFHGMIKRLEWLRAEKNRLEQETKTFQQPAN